jgi:hypothetical protein
MEPYSNGIVKPSQVRLATAVHGLALRREAQQRRGSGDAARGQTGYCDGDVIRCQAGHSKGIAKQDDAKQSNGYAIYCTATALSREAM